MNQPTPWQVKGHVELGSDADSLLGDRRPRPLECLADTGSITRAAKRLGLSYRAAWNAVDARCRHTSAVSCSGCRRSSSARIPINCYRGLP